MGWEDLLAAEKRGRWWIVGSSWQQQPAEEREKKEEQKKTGPGESVALLELASRYRMNTDLRRRIFCAMMSAEDAWEGVERVQRLGLSGQEEREIVHIAVACALKEASFNPFYAHFLALLPRLHSRFALTLQYALWDRIKELPSLKTRQNRHLALLTALLIRLSAISLSALRIIEFAKLTEKDSDFLSSCFQDLYLSLSSEELTPLFTALTGQKQREKNENFLEGLKLFLPNIFLRRIKRVKEQESREKLAATNQLVLNLLTQSSSSHLL